LDFVMREATFSKAVFDSFWALAVALSACAVAQGGPPEISGAGNGGFDVGGSFAAGGVAGTGVGVSGSGFGVSGSNVGPGGSTSIAGTSSGAFGGTGSALGGTSSVAGTVGSAGTSSVAGSSHGGGGAAAGAGGRGTAGSSAAGSGSAGTGATSCSLAAWSADKVYQGGDKASKNGMQYTAAYYTMGNDPTAPLNCCGGGKFWQSSAPCN
jgi:hypothetical protein